MLHVGAKIGAYEVVAQLKSGGMATLYLGKRAGAAGFARHVAIKVVHPHLATNTRFVRMFVDEALLSAQIHHPNVVHVEELGEADGSYFLVMEYVHGCSLSQLLRALARARQRLSPALAVHIAIQIADGLHAAHETTDGQGALLGVVHRDVSPQNVLLSYKGHVKLIDFGIAKAAGRADHTGTGFLKGKLRYMAPEQAFGREVDRRADLYALGIVLWEALTMRRPFDAESELALLEQVRDPRIVPPRRLMPALPPALDAAVMSALARERDARPATAQEFRRRLAEALPAALAIEASDLAGLLRTLLRDEIDRERATLPQSMSGVLSHPPPADLGSLPSQPGRGEGAGAGEALVLDASDVRLEEEGDLPAVEVTPGGAARSVPTVEAHARAGRGRAAPWVAGAVAVTLVAGGAVAVISSRSAPSTTHNEPGAPSREGADAGRVARAVVTEAAPVAPSQVAPRVEPAAVDAGTAPRATDGTAVRAQGTGRATTSPARPAQRSPRAQRRTQTINGVPIVDDEF